MPFELPGSSHLGGDGRNGFLNASSCNDHFWPLHVGIYGSDTICEFCFELGGPRAHEGEAMTSPASCISHHSQMGLCLQLLEKPFIRSSKPDTCQPLLSIFRVCPHVCIQLEDTKTGTATSTSNSLAAADKNFSSLLPLLLLFLLLLNSKQEAQVLTQA